MHHRLLLGSTALVGAGVLFTNAASAQEEQADSRSSWVAYTEFGLKAATDDTLGNERQNQNYSFFMDNEVIIRAHGVTDGGVRYGSKVEIEVGGGGDAGSDGMVSRSTRSACSSPATSAGSSSVATTVPRI